MLWIKSELLYWKTPTSKGNRKVRCTQVSTTVVEKHLTYSNNGGGGYILNLCFFTKKAFGNIPNILRRSSMQVLGVIYNPGMYTNSVNFLMCFVVGPTNVYVIHLKKLSSTFSRVIFSHHLCFVHFTVWRQPTYRHCAKLTITEFSTHEI